MVRYSAYHCINLKQGQVPISHLLCDNQITFSQGFLKSQIQISFFINLPLFLLNLVYKLISLTFPIPIFTLRLPLLIYFILSDSLTIAIQINVLEFYISGGRLPFQYRYHLQSPYLLPLYLKMAFLLSQVQGLNCNLAF